MFRTMLKFFVFFVVAALLLVGIYMIPTTSVLWFVLWICLGLGAGIFYWIERHALRSRIAAIISLILYLLGWLGLAASMRQWFVMPDWVNEISNVLIIIGLFMSFTAGDGTISEKSRDA